MALPNEPGFAVNLRSGEIHKRYAPHALGLRRTTALGLMALLDEREPEHCPECFPPQPVKEEPPSPKTSTRFTSKPVKVVKFSVDVGEDWDALRTEMAEKLTAARWEEAAPNAEELLVDREAKMTKADDGTDDAG